MLKFNAIPPSLCEQFSERVAAIFAAHQSSGRMLSGEERSRNLYSSQPIAQRRRCRHNTAAIACRQVQLNMCRTTGSLKVGDACAPVLSACMTEHKREFRYTAVIELHFAQIG